jgi:hypothetical protein
MDEHLPDAPWLASVASSRFDTADAGIHLEEGAPSCSEQSCSAWSLA